MKYFVKTHFVGAKLNSAIFRFSELFRGREFLHPDYFFAHEVGFYFDKSCTCNNKVCLLCSY